MHTIFEPVAGFIIRHKPDEIVQRFFALLCSKSAIDLLLYKICGRGRKVELTGIFETFQGEASIAAGLFWGCY
jgi:hypothetical protein